MRPGEQSPGGASGPTVQQLVGIRAGIFLGPILFGLVTWWLRRQGSTPGRPGEGGLLRVVVPALAVIAVIAAFALRARLADVADVARRGNLKLSAWAVGHTVALAGAVHYFLAGDARSYAVGVAAMLVTFAVVPARDGD